MLFSLQFTNTEPTYLCIKLPLRQRLKRFKMKSSMFGSVLAVSVYKTVKAISLENSPECPGSSRSMTISRALVVKAKELLRAVQTTFP